MHEFGLVMAMVALAESELERAGCAAPIKQLNLTVGRLSGASPEALQTAFELVAHQKGWPEARLAITEKAATCLCHACGRVSEITELIFTCPHCSDPVCEIQGGRDLQLSSIDVED